MDNSRRIDLSTFISDFNDRSTGIAILRKFAEQLQSDIIILHEDLEGKNHREFHRRAHAIKGGAMNIGAHGLQDKAKVVEQFYKENNYFNSGMTDNQKAEIKEKLSFVEDEIEYIVEYISTL